MLTQLISMQCSWMVGIGWNCSYKLYMHIFTSVNEGSTEGRKTDGNCLDVSKTLDTKMVHIKLRQPAKRNKHDTHKKKNNNTKWELQKFSARQTNAQTLCFVHSRPRALTLMKFFFSRFANIYNNFVAHHPIVGGVVFPLPHCV